MINSKRAYYSSSIIEFISSSSDSIIGSLSQKSQFSIEQTQLYAWKHQIAMLKTVLSIYDGSIFFEYSIPRMGRRIDVLAIIGPVLFVLEFKVGEKEYNSAAFDQVWDYALDLKNFHETSHHAHIAPILICTKAKTITYSIAQSVHNDKLLFPIQSNGENLRAIIDSILVCSDGETINGSDWVKGRYAPTPTIVEAAKALYCGHSVEEISRTDAGAINLSKTTKQIDSIIEQVRTNRKKAICFVTGVPGAGKTLVGLDIATSHIDQDNDMYSVYLSGNGPLVSILREALTRDKVQREKDLGHRITKGKVLSEVKLFVQNVHNFRDDCLDDITKAPLEHVALFDEAQRAWNVEQTSSFMLRKKNHPNFEISEPEFLISCMDRHSDWSVVVCLVGGGQEINTGEAGIGEWLSALRRSFPHWNIYISPQLNDAEYGASEMLHAMANTHSINYLNELHLSVSMRSFRAENVSTFVKEVLDLNANEARQSLLSLEGKYPIVLTRSIQKAKAWLKQQARGSERYGIVVSSQAERLKPHAIYVKAPIDPIHWFLNGKSDVRSSYYLEDVATEFHIQGLELDWSCVTWDADFRYGPSGWENWSFVGNKWKKIRKVERKLFQKNAYRVLLTRARQGMVIVVPEGAIDDHSRIPEYYDATFEYLRSLGLREIV